MTDGYSIEFYSNSDSSQNVNNSAEILCRLQKIKGKVPLCSREGIEQEIFLLSPDGIRLHYEGNILNNAEDLQELEKTLKEINRIGNF